MIIYMSVNFSFYQRFYEDIIKKYLVVIYSLESFNKFFNPLPVKIIEFINPCPSGKGDLAIKIRIRRKNDFVSVVIDNIRQIFYEFAAIILSFFSGDAIILDHYSAVLKIVDLEFIGYRIFADSPLGFT